MVDYILENRKKELAAYRQFPFLSHMYGSVLEQYLSVYEDKADTSALSEEDMKWVEKNPEADIFLYAFGHEEFGA